jgi:hypothetical protein
MINSTFAAGNSSCLASPHQLGDSTTVAVFGSQAPRNFGMTL